MRESNAQSKYGRIGVVIPALDEELSLRELLPRLGEYQLGQIVVGDNGSSDGTAAVASEHGCTVVHESRRGYGAACWAALQALRPDIDVVLFLDADSSDDLTRLPDIVGPVLRGEADLVIATRDAATVERGAMTAQQRLGNWLAVTLIRLRWGFRYRDSHKKAGLHWSAAEHGGLSAHARFMRIPPPCRKEPAASRLAGP